MHRFFLALSLFSQVSMAANMEGRVFFKSKGSRVEAKNQAVFVRIFSKSKQAEIASSESLTDSQGRYRFQDLQTSSEYIYLIKTEFEGVSYTEGPLQFLANTTQMSVRPIEMTYAHGSLADLTIEESIALAFGKNDLIKVSHTLSMQNMSDLTYSPKKEGAEQLNFSLPEGAFDFQVGNDETRELFSIDQVKGLTLEQSIPGGTQNPFPISYSYLLAYKSSKRPIAFVRSASLRSMTVNLIDGPKVRVSNSDLAFEAGSLSRMVGKTIAAKKQIVLELSHLPLKNAFFHRLLWIGFALLALILGIFAWMPRQKQSFDKSYLTILGQLKQLTLSHQQGLISSEAFELENQRLRDIAYILIQKQHGTNAPSI